MGGVLILKTPLFCAKVLFVTIKLSHIEIEKHTMAVYQTLRGAEILTPELPNVSGKDLEHLDERGIAKIGSFVNPGDILVSKLSPARTAGHECRGRTLTSHFWQSCRRNVRCQFACSPWLRVDE